jgi:hypothetical protein
MSLFDDQLAEYFEARAGQRERDLDNRLAELSPREQSLIRDAAVMGYVLGRTDERAGCVFPRDTSIFRGVVYAALRDEKFHVLRGAVYEYTQQPATEGGGT